MGSRALAIVALLLALVACGCGGGAGTGHSCSSRADCGPGETCTGGVCAPAPDAGPPADATPRDGGSDGGACPPPAPPAPDCPVPSVSCDTPPPDCPSGYYPARDGSGACWTGDCVPCTAPPGCGSGVGDAGCSASCPDGAYAARAADGTCACLGCTIYCLGEVRAPGDAGICAAPLPACPPWQRPNVIWYTSDEVYCYGHCVPCDCRL